MKLKNAIFINKNLKTSIKKICANLKKKKVDRYCYHKKSSKNGQFMIINRPKGLRYKGTTFADSSVWLVIEGEMSFKLKNKNFLLKKNDFIFLKKNVLYKNYAKKDTILIEFKSSYHL